MGLYFLGTARANNTALQTSISDLEIVQTSGGAKLVSVSGPQGGVAAFQLNTNGVPTKQGHAFLLSNQVTGGGHDIEIVKVGSSTYVQVSGFNTNAVVSYLLNGSGSFTNKSVLGGATIGSAAPVFARTDGGKTLLADPGKPGFYAFHAPGNGSLQQQQYAGDTGSVFARNVVDIDTARVGSADIAVVASYSERGVTSYTVGSSTPVARDSVGPQDGLGIMVPTDVEITKVGTKTFAIIGSEPSRGKSGALSVLEVKSNGQLEPVDHVLDTGMSRFGEVQKIASVTHSGKTYVVAGGGDYGLSIFRLLPDGKLVHLDSIAGTKTHPLEDITALEVAVVGNRLQIFAATEDSNGISVLAYNLSAEGSVRIAGAGSSSLTGTSNNDILVDGPGSDTLTGGAGADQFVFDNDGKTDTITDFNPAQDTLDLSDILFLYDPNALTITSTSNGANVTYRGETFILKSHNGASLSAKSVKDAVALDVNRAFYYVPSENDPPPSTGGGGSGSGDGSSGGGSSGSSGGGSSSGGNGGGGNTGSSNPPQNVLVNGTIGADNIKAGEGNDTIFGFAGDDRLDGAAGNDSILGGDGKDVVLGADDNDTLSGGDGDDFLRGQDGNDHIYGNSGNDILLGEIGSDRIIGGTGSDYILGGNQNDTLYGGTGNDSLNGERDDDVAFGEDGNDVISGKSGNDTLLGGAGNDIIYGGLDNDNLFGQDGDDFLFGESGDDFANGGKGIDYLLGGDGDDRLYGGADLDRLHGNNGNDILVGGSGNDVLQGHKDNDSLYGEGGNDFLRGQDNNDLLSGGSGNDIILGENGRDRVRAGAGDDFVRGGNENDTIYGDDGRDRIDGGDGTDVLFGNNGNDVVSGKSGSDTLLGGDGNDILYGGSGDDALHGLEDNDTLVGEKGNDFLNGGNGRDFLLGGDGDDRLYGGESHDRLDGQNQDDRLYGGSGNDTLLGSQGNDVLTGEKGNDRLFGGSGNDRLSGGSANDLLSGGSGSDNLTGGSGRDTLEGNAGADRLTGGPQPDRFVFRKGDNRDVILDFNALEDRISIDEDLFPGRMSKASFVNKYAKVVGNNTELRFDNGDTLVIEDFRFLNQLDDVIDFV